MRGLRKAICALLCLAAVCALLPLGAGAKAAKIVRVGWYEGTYNTTGPNGERSGCSYEFQQAVAAYTGWEYEYVEGTWNDLLQMLQDGDIDLMGGVSKTDERERTMLFSELPMGKDRYYLYADLQNSGISAADLSTLNGKRIGMLSGGVSSTRFTQWEQNQGIQTKHVSIIGAEDVRQKLQDRRIDGFVLNESPQWREEGLTALAQVGIANNYFVLSPSRPDLKAELDRAMARIEGDRPFYMDELYDRYLSSVTKENLTPVENQWLDNHGNIRVGYLNGDSGVSAKDPETGKLTGVIMDYVTLAAGSLQGRTLGFELRGYNSRAEQIQALHNGDIDMIFHVSQNPYSAETNGFALSNTVWTFNLAAITAKKDFSEEDANTAAVLRDNMSLKAYLSYNYPHWTVREYGTMEDAKEAVLKGKADCLLVNSGKVGLYLRDSRLSGVFLTRAANTSFAVNRGDGTLLSILNKTLQAVPTARLSGAVTMYNSRNNKVSFLDFAKDNLVFAMLILLVVVGALGAAWVKSMRAAEETKAVNRKLRQALQEAKAQSQIIGAIGKSYSFIYRFDLRDGTFQEVSPDVKVHHIAGISGRLADVKDRVLQAMVAEEYLPVVTEFIDLSSLPERLRDTDSISMEYRTPQDTWQMGRLIVKDRDEKGDVTEVLYAVRNIDKQKQMENRYKRQLLQNDRVLSGLSMDYTIAIVLDLDTDDYNIVFSQSTNHAEAQKTVATFREYAQGYAKKFVLPPFRDAMCRELSSANIRRRFAQEKDFHFYFETIPNAAGLSCFQAHIVREYDEGGHFAFLGFRSVDEAVNQERYYKEALQNQLKLMTASIPGGVKISNDDATYSFKYVSEQFAAMLGYATPEELTAACGGCIIGLVHPDDLSTGLADALDQYSRADYYATTYRVRCKDGSYKYIEDRGRKVRAADGTIEHWNLILDKNDLMEKTIALESERKANQSKTDFLSRMSHDMRTPLNGIMGLLKIDLDHFEDQALVRQNHQKMLVSANHLLSLINDVLQMSKIEEGTTRLAHEVMNFNDLSHDIAVMAFQRAEETGIQMHFSTKKKTLLYPYVYGSPLHLRQIFLNIYSNGIKYNRPGGSITSVADYWLEKDGRVTYEWSISDTGIGMSPEFLRHLFDPFAQEREDARSVYQGTGLGMAITKGLIDQMGGTIEVTSQLNVGSTFLIRIPFDIAPVPQAKAKAPEKKASIRGLNLLLAEDNELNGEIAQMLLQDAGATTTLVTDGKQALEAFQNAPAGTYDAILMDIMMPVMDGLEATKAIRGLARKDAQKIPIIAMTANAFQEDADKCLAAGMTAHLAKPLEPEKMIKAIAKYCGK